MVANPSRLTTRTITTSDATAHLETVVDRVATGEDEVILERDGTPKAVVISFEEYRHLLAVREEERKAEAVRWLREFQATYDGRNDDLTEDELMELAVRATKEIRAERWEEAQQHLQDDQQPDQGSHDQ